MKGKEVRATTVAIVFLFICLAVFVGALTYFVADAAQQTRNRLEDRAQSSAQVVATNAQWIAQVAQQTLRRVDALLGDDLARDTQTLQAAVDGLPADIDVYIVDADANIIFTTVPGAEQINVADREYFTVLREGAAFYTSPRLVSRVTQRDVFVFTKRVQRDGRFAGAVMVSFSDDLLQSFWTALELTPGSTVSLVRRDGQLMARFPSPQEDVDLSQHPLVTRHLAQADFGTYFSETSPVDGVPRVVGYRSIPGTQIVALASIATDRTWDELRRDVIAVFVIVAPVVLALLALGYWVVRLLRRDARRRNELEAAQETNVLLFREIHHRVKNNLQSVQSLVRMQDMPKSAKIDLQSRLSAMAAMHEHIYRHDRYEDIDAHELVPVVVDEVVHAYGADVDLVFEVDHVGVDRDHATPLSLLLSELVTNVLKYAFADGRRGTITISLRREGDGRCKLVVADNGIGIGPVPDNPTSMGLRLIRGVVSQMGGTFRFISGEGTRFEADLALATTGHSTTMAVP